MPRIASILVATLVVLGTAFLPSKMQGQELSPDAFYGHFVGSGFTFGDVAYYELTNRDLDVEIGPDMDGFFVAWTTVFRPTGAKKPHRNSSRISFVPTNRPNFYVERSAANRVGEGLTWATINGQMLSVFVLSILDDASYALQAYHRILSREGMILQYRSDDNGQTTRMVSATLTKKK